MNQLIWIALLISVVASFGTAPENLDDLVTLGRFSKKEIQYVKLANSQVPEAVAQEFSDLYFDWAWKKRLMLPGNPGQVFGNLEARRESEEITSQLVDFIKKNPETISLLVEKMLLVQSNYDWSYILYEPITGDHCEHFGDHHTASYECARKWIHQTMPKGSDTLEQNGWFGWLGQFLA